MNVRTLPGIDPETERVLSVAEAAARQRVTAAAVYDWIAAGKLRASRIRGRIKTSAEALEELNAPQPITLRETPPTPAQRRKPSAAHRAAEAKLDKMGIR